MGEPRRVGAGFGQAKLAYDAAGLRVDWPFARLRNSMKSRGVSFVPLAQQYLLDCVAPPAIAVMWWFMSRGWAMTVQGEGVSDRTKRRQRIEFLVLLVGLYSLMFGATTYMHFHH